MRIAVIGPLEMPSAQGGMTRHCVELYSRLVERGHSVTVFCQRGDPSGSYRGMRLRRVPGVRLPGWERLGYSLVATWLARRGPYDVVHYHSFASAGFCGLARHGPRRLVVTVHRLEWQDEKWGRLARAFLRRAERQAARHADALITVSRNFRTDLERRYPDAGPIHYVANGVSAPLPVGPEALAPLGLTPGRYLLYVGRVVPEKGVHLALAAFRRVRNAPEADGWALAIVGGARHSDRYVRTLVADTDEHVHWLGTRTGETLAALYAHAGLLVAPSFHEGQPLTVLEAMSYGRAVVASDIAAHQELVDGAGIFFRSGDSDDLAARLREVLRDPDRIPELGRTARDRVVASGEFDWDHTADETERILSSR